MVLPLAFTEGSSLRAPDGSVVVAVPAAQDIELNTLENKTTDVFRQPDGTYKAEVYAEPVNYKRADGSWADIDPTLVSSSQPGYALESNAGPLDIALAGDARAGDMVRVAANGTSVAFGPEAPTSLAPPVAFNATATYANVYPGVDLVYESLPNALKESIVLHAAPLAPVSYRFELSLDGLTAQEEKDGSISLLRSNGEVEFLIPHAWMQDSAIDLHSGDPAFSEAVTYNLEAKGDALVLAVTPALGWLQDPARVYPVRIDPTVTTRAAALDTFVQSDITTVQNTATELKAGTFDGGTTKARSLFQFNVSGFSTKHVLSTTFDVYETWSFSCSARPLNVYRIDASWLYSVKWSNQPAVHTPKTDQINVAKGYNSGGCADGWISFDISNLAQNWINGSVTNNGLELRADDETDSYGWKKFKSAETASPPHLTITYNTAPGLPTALSPADATVNTTTGRTTPTLSAVYNDTDTADTGRVNYQVCSTSSCTPSSAIVVSGAGTPNVSPGAASPWTVPSGYLLSGSQYWWRARGDDGTDVSAWTTPARSYTPNLLSNVPTSLRPNTGLVTTLAPTFSGLYDDQDGNDSGYLYFEVYNAATNALVASGSGPTVQPGRESSWAAAAGSFVDGGSYYWRAEARDGNQNSGFSANRSFLISVGGDIYLGKSYTGDPAAGGELVAQEWVRINTLTARHEDSDVLATRTTVPCDESNPQGPQCEEVRGRTQDTIGDTMASDDAYWLYSSHAGDLQLDQVAHILGPANDSQGSFLQSGPLTGTLETWQSAPPSNDGAYDLYQLTDGETGEVVKTWVETRTRMPLKQQFYDSAGALQGELYWDYFSQRLTTGQVPTDHFRLVRPAGITFDEEGKLVGDEHIGSIADQQTGASFRPLYLGGKATLPTPAGTSTLCLIDIAIVHQAVADSARQVWTDPDPELVPDPSGPETYVSASYSVVSDPISCTPGSDTLGDSVVDVMSIAAPAALAEAYGNSYIEPAIAIQSDPLSYDYARAGVTSILVGGQPATGYVLTDGSEDGTALLKDASAATTTLDETMVILSGPFDKTTLDGLVGQLVEP